MLRVEAKNYVLLREYNLPAPQPDPPQPSLKGRESSPFKGELEGVWLWGFALLFYSSVCSTTWPSKRLTMRSAKLALCCECVTMTMVVPSS